MTHASAYLGEAVSRTRPSPRLSLHPDVEWQLWELMAHDLGVSLDTQLRQEMERVLRIAIADGVLRDIIAARRSIRRSKT